MPIEFFIKVWYNVITVRDRELKRKVVSHMTKRNEMKKAIVDKFGLEHPNTIKFFEITSRHYAPMKMIEFYFNKFMSENIFEDDE